MRRDLDQVAARVVEHRGGDRPHRDRRLREPDAERLQPLVLGLDELSLAREWDSRDDREAALLRYLRPLDEQRQCPSHLLEEAREAGWTDEQLLEAVAVVALEAFTAMVHIAGDVPADGSVEDARVLRAA